MAGGSRLTGPVSGVIDDCPMQSSDRIGVIPTPAKLHLGLKPRESGTALAVDRRQAFKVTTRTNLPGRIEHAIIRIRGLNVMLDADLAPLYGVDVRTLNQAVKRNRRRFPSDFMFQVGRSEGESLRSRTVIIEKSRKARTNLRSQSVI